MRLSRLQAPRGVEAGRKEVLYPRTYVRTYIQEESRGIENVQTAQKQRAVSSRTAPTKMYKFITRNLSDDLGRSIPGWINSQRRYLSTARF